MKYWSQTIYWKWQSTHKYEISLGLGILRTTSTCRREFGHPYIFRTVIQTSDNNPSWILQTFSIYCTPISAFTGKEKERNVPPPQRRVLRQQEFKGTIQWPDNSQQQEDSGVHNVMITLNGLNNALHAVLSSCLQQRCTAAYQYQYMVITSAQRGAETALQKSTCYLSPLKSVICRFPTSFKFQFQTQTVCAYKNIHARRHIFVC